MLKTKYIYIYIYIYIYFLRRTGYISLVCLVAPEFWIKQTRFYAVSRIVVAACCDKTLIVNPTYRLNFFCLSVLLEYAAVNISQTIFWLLIMLTEVVIIYSAYIYISSGIMSVHAHFQKDPPRSHPPSIMRQRFPLPLILTHFYF